jgi:arylsulfatase A-like enzyme
MQPNIILLVIDSIRSDKFFSVDTTSKKPNIDNLIQNGTYFSQTITSADATILSWSSLYTGKYPFKTGIRSSRFNKLDDNTLTMFNLLQQSGYFLYSFTPTFSETIGLFPKFQNENNFYDFTETLDTGLGNKILDVLSSVTTEHPWFLNIHLMDLHYPLTVPSNFNSELFGFSKYERVISSIDSWIKKIINCIDLNNTILIITGDHGAYIKKIKKDSDIIDFEDNGKNEILKKKLISYAPKFIKPLKDKIFFSNESKNNSKNLKILSKYDLNPFEKRALMSGHFSIEHDLYDEKLCVPLLFVGKNIDQNKIFSKQVRLIDILPTICFLAKIDFNDASFDGNSLIPFKNETEFEELPVYIESNPLIDIKSNDVIGIRTSQFKYFRDKYSKSNRVHLFDLTNDPLEEKNIANINIKKVSEMESILEKILTNHEELQINESDDVSKEIESELKKMGYI